MAIMDVRLEFPFPHGIEGGIPKQWFSADNFRAFDIPVGIHD
jgi:hypothetical protein